MYTMYKRSVGKIFLNCFEAVLIEFSLVLVACCQNQNVCFLLD
jgi:hypothetical protein